MDDYCFLVKKKLGASYSCSCFLCIVEYVVDNIEGVCWVINNNIIVSRAMKAKASKLNYMD